MKGVIPTNSRYIPLTQQRWHCVPTCFQMIMYKHKIPLFPAEKIGYHLGLVVHPKNKKLFFNPRTSKNPPVAGYGTQISKPQFSISRAFKKLEIPLKMEIISPLKFKSDKDLGRLLSDIEKKNGNALFCFNHGALNNSPQRSGGHVVVFDRMVKGKIRFIDPSPKWPKWRLVTTEKMLKAMKKHKNPKSGGVWVITKTKNKVPHTIHKSEQTIL